MEQSRVSYLTERYLSQTATHSEQEEFFEIVKSAQNDDSIREIFAQGWLNYTTAEEIPVNEADRLFDSILHQAEGLQQRSAKIVSMKNWGRLAVAASIILLISVGSYFFLLNKTKKKDELAKVKVAEPVKDIAAPTSSKASITLANGQTVFLDSMSSGTLAVQGNIKVIKNEKGEIVYSGISGEEVFNTLYNPRGSKVVSLTLSDGTQVWLNAESSLKYPAAFVGNERKVEITGEAYFEVAHNAANPFKVSVKGIEVKVLGTNFNVNAYDDEAMIKTSLLKGSVQVQKDKAELILTPGQQAQTTGGGQITLNKNVDLDEVMAWKNGLFSFNKTDIKTVMRQLSRWYDVDVNFAGKIPEGTYDGAIRREAPLSKILEILKVAGIEFTIEGKKLIVTGG